VETACQNSQNQSGAVELEQPPGPEQSKSALSRRAQNFRCRTFVVNRDVERGFAVGFLMLLFLFFSRAPNQHAGSGVRGWREGCRRDWRAHCSPVPAVSVPGPTGAPDTRHVIFSEPGRRRSPVLRPRQGTCDEAAGSPMPRAPACGIRHWGGTIDNMPCVWSAGSILHDRPERSEVLVCARSLSPQTVPAHGAKWLARKVS
jgi:hypothetical protein